MLDASGGGGLVEVPAVAASSEIEGNPGIEIAAPGEPPPGPTDTDRVPVLAALDEEGLRDPDVGPPPLPQGDTPQEIAASLTPLLAEGSENLDVFGVGPFDADHFALVYPTEVNYETAGGKWKDIVYSLVPDDYGWTGAGGEADVRLPAALGPATPVVFQIPEGSLETVPEGITDPGVKGVLNGEFTVVYPEALGATDLRYTYTPHGYKEEIVLKDASAGSAVSWRIRASGLSLALGTAGEVLVYAGESQIGMMPTPVARDSTADPQESVGAYALEDQGSGNFRLSVVLDPAFLAKATYPVVIDPGDATRYALRDTYTSSANGGGDSFEGSDRLWVGPGKHTFVRFQIDGLQQDERLVYWADLFAYKMQGTCNGDIEAKRVLDTWPPTITWNDEPEAGQTIDPKEDRSQAPWFLWDMAELYQHYIQTGYPDHWPEHGLRLSSTDDCGFASQEESTGNGTDPVLFVTYNDLPGKPTLDQPADDVTIETESPTLKVAKGAANWPSDRNGDEVLIRFEISTSQNNFSQNIVWTSPAIDEHSYVVPAGVLTDGETYWWRARGWDVCDQPDTMCPFDDGAGVEHEESATPARKFTLSLKHFGEDSRYAMWSHEVGNGMVMKVNEANGNLFLDAPLDSLATPIGDLEISLSYNSQQAADYGLSPGWDLAIGPAASGREMPIELQRVTPIEDGGVKIRLRGGRTIYFAHRDSRVFAGVGSGVGVVRQADNGEFTYTTAEGSTYTFQANGKLIDARPRGATAASGANAFKYTFNASNQLTRVRDPLNRDITAGWNANGKLESILTWEGSPYPARGWSFTYSTAGRLETIITPAGEAIRFSYDASGRLSEVQNGDHIAADPDQTGWKVTYLTDPIGNGRVSTIRPAGAPAGEVWAFEYPTGAGSFRGTTAAWACVTDPRGVADGTCDGSYQTKVDFAWSGLPIQITGPPDQTGHWPVTTMVWDSNNNMICKRAPAANAKQIGCTASTGTNGALNTVYDYEAKGPYRMKTVTDPAPSFDGTGARQTVEYRYDEGASFNGLWAEIFETADLSGIPDDEAMWTNFDKDWDFGAPPAIDDPDRWSIRFTGYLDLQDANNSKKYKFRLSSNDGATLVIGNSTLTNCFGQPQTFNDYNCGTNQDAIKRLSPGLKPITLEYSEIEQQARLKLEWDQGNDTWQTMPGWRFQGNLGIVTTVVGSKMMTTYAYPDDLDKSRRLPDFETASNLSGGSERTTTYTYTNNYGQLKTVTTPAGATTTNSYTNDAASKVTCLTQSTTDVSATDTIVATYECDQAGNVTKVTQQVDAVANQPAQSRVTTTTYDLDGRIDTVDLQGTTGVDADYRYDAAGRVDQIERLVDGATYAKTNYRYDQMGRLTRETFPDPDGTGPATRAFIDYGYAEWVDNVTSRTDPRDGALITTMAHDGLNRVIQVTSPTGLVATTEYRLSTGGTNDYRTTATDPANVKTVTTLDVLGRATEVKVEALQPTRYEYDEVGNVTKVTDPAGVVTKTTYNAFSQVSQVTQFPNTAKEAVTDYSYDAAGLLDTVDGPRTGVTDVLDYDYDNLGRLKTASQTGAFLPGTTTPLTTTFVYDDASERVRASTPLTTTTAMVRDWTYDQNGWLASFADARATTTYAYYASGWLKQANDPRGYTLRFNYDNLGRLTCRYDTATCPSTPSGNAEAFGYDAAGNLTQAANAQATFNLEYDNEGRPWKVKRGGTLETTFTYTSGRLTSIADAAGTTAYAYFPNNDPFEGLLKTIDDPFTTGLTTYTYDTAGRTTQRTDPAGLCWTRTYEADTGRVDTQTTKAGCSGATLASFDLGFDKAGNVTSKYQSVSGNSDSGTWGYSYDAASRLETATAPDGVVTTYAYDGGGNRRSVQVGSGAVVTTTYDEAGLPTSSSDGTTFTHDAAGNLTKIDRSGTSSDWAFGYDTWGRMSCAKQSTSCGSGTQNIAFSYDALNRALSRTKGSSSTTYTYQGISEEIAKTVSGATTTLYAYSPGGPLAQKSGNNKRFFLSDPHGDVVGMANTSATVKGTLSFSPWGEKRTLTGEQAVLGFQGDPTDADSGLVDMLARGYNPSLGRFMTRDALFGDPLNPITLNQYVYGNVNPVSMWDPLGLHANWKHVRACKENGSYCWYHINNPDNPAPPGYSATGEPEPAVPQPPTPRELWQIIRDPDLGWDVRIDAAWQYVELYPEQAREMVDRWVELERVRLEAEGWGSTWGEIRERKNSKILQWGALFIPGLYGLAGGSNCEVRRRGFTVCFNQPPPYGPGSGFTLGNTFFTPKSEAQVEEKVNEGLLAHERLHANWWAIMGIDFGFEYWRHSETYGECNFFEYAAGYEAGNYEC